MPWVNQSPATSRWAAAADAGESWDPRCSQEVRRAIADIGVADCMVAENDDVLWIEK
jgi:hypothetical protein